MLEITIDTGATLHWPYHGIRQSQGAYEGEQVRLERGGEYPEMLVVENPKFLEDLHRVAPQLTRRFHSPMRRVVRWSIAVVTAISVVVLASALYFRALPAVAVIVASRVPPAWEAHLGERTVAHLVPPDRRCTDATVARAIQVIVTTLTASRPSPYTFRVVVVQSRVVNAFAAPGGFLVVNRGLLENTRTPEELAGVLAHEIQHVVHRHATKSIIEHAGLAVLVAAITGDPTGAAAIGVEAARTLAAARYTRAAEEEADREGLRLLLAAHVDPRGMISFFERLGESAGREPGVLAFLSTHPRTEDRVSALRAMADAAPPAGAPLLEADEWEALKQVCK